MADFKTHISGSTLAGLGIGLAGLSYGFPIQSCLLAGGLCSVAGILPDLDSDSGVPYRESVAFISAFVPLLLVSRFQSLGWTRESIVLACALIYLAFRFGVAELFRRYTVHRGMWHSMPAAMSVGLVTFLIADYQDLRAARVLGGGGHSRLPGPPDSGRTVQCRFPRRAAEEVLWHGAEVLVDPRTLAQHLDLR